MNKEEFYCHYSDLPSPMAYAETENHSMLNIDRIIEMAWEDRTPFEAIKFQFQITEQQVIEIMRLNLKHSSFKRWRKRVQGRKTKHLHKRCFVEGNFKCNEQRMISNNKISKKKY